MLQEIINWILYGLFQMDSASRVSQSINFFLYDSIKIILLIIVLITIIGFLRTYISQTKIKTWLTKKGAGWSNFVASIFGALTPFCSCSSIPIFIGFLEAGVPLGTAFSFIITSPLVNEYLVVLMLGFFGWKITLAYVVSGILLGTIGGMILGKMNLKNYLVKDFIVNDSNSSEKVFKTIKERLHFGWKEAKDIIKKIWVWILVGVGVGAIIHNYVPAEWLTNTIGSIGVFGVPLAVILGVPMYGSCAAIVPIAVVLFEKGIPLGIALAFMMATSALSLPEAIILRRAMKLRLILIFFGVVTLGIIITGFLLNMIQGMLG
ncbi:MAG: permease [archaeon]